MAEYYTDEQFLNDLPLWGDDEAQHILLSVCEKHNVPVEAITQLVAIQRERQNQEKARGINQAFEEVLGLID